MNECSKSWNCRVYNFPGNFPGKPENSGKIPVSRESTNLGKSTPLHPTSFDSALSQNKLEPIPPCANTFGTYSTLLILDWDLFHLCNISSGTYSTFSIFQVGPIPQSQKSFWDLFHSLNFFFKHHGWNRSQLEVEKVPIILGPIPPPIGTYSTLKLCGTNSTLKKSGTYSTVSIGT